MYIPYNWRCFVMFLVVLTVCVLDCQSQTVPTEGSRDVSEVEIDASQVDAEAQEEDVEVQVTGEPLSVSIGQTDDPEEGDGEPFIATTEWQTIKPGQTIPRGLHVRMNMQTGKKEAKLLEKDEEETQPAVESDKPAEKPADSVALVPQEDNGVNVEIETGRMLRMKHAIEDAMADLEKDQKEGPHYWKNGDKEGMMNVNKNVFSRDELKEALKKFKATTDDVSDEKVAEESKKKKFRHIDDLKKEFEKLNLNVKTDYEIITELYNKYKKKELSLEERKEILTDLEYYLHQIDNAKDFAKMGGLSLVIKDLNHTEESVRSEAAFVIGSATQSNPPVQVQAIESGALHQLIRMLAIQSTVSLRNRIIYALSSIIRHFPYAQQRFIQLGGFAALSSLFHQDVAEKLKVKCVTLITDLVLEQKHTIEHDISNEEKVIQYKGVPLIETLKEQGWCELIPVLLSSPEHDAREKVLVAMDSLANHCRDTFIKSLSKLARLKTEYEHLSKTEIAENTDDQYFTGLLHTVDGVMKDLNLKDEL